jgi:hypothetical protein
MAPRKLVIGLISGLAIAGCGSSSSSNSNGNSKAADATEAVAFANCMRSHGVSNFPDLGPQGELSVTPGSGINPFSPAFEAAQRACAKLQPGATQPPPQPSAADVRAGLAWAECVRKHGVPNFPDPSYSANQTNPTLEIRGLQFQVGPNFDPRSPAFEQAQTACGFGLGGAKVPPRSRSPSTG